jgi:hypothetical protein
MWRYQDTNPKTSANAICAPLERFPSPIASTILLIPNTKAIADREGPAIITTIAASDNRTFVVKPRTFTTKIVNPRMTASKCAVSSGSRMAKIPSTASPAPMIIQLIIQCSFTSISLLCYFVGYDSFLPLLPRGSNLLF